MTVGSTREPLLTNGSIISLVTAVLALVVSFGLKLDQDQQAAILGVTAAVVPLVVAFTTRSKVTPVASPQNDAGRALIPVPAERTLESEHDLGSVTIIVLIVLAVIGLLALLGYGGIG